jgi:hypothetical protein
MQKETVKKTEQMIKEMVLMMHKNGRRYSKHKETMSPFSSPIKIWTNLCQWMKAFGRALANNSTKPKQN